MTVPSTRFLACSRSPRTGLGLTGALDDVHAVRGVRRCAGAADLAAEAWRAMVHAVFARRDYMAVQAAQFDLTLPQAHLLQVISRGRARTMAAIAEALACDASNVTGIVDRLEARRLIVRRSAKHDRRVRTIALTAQGLSVVGELTRRMMEPPDGFLRLTATELSVLRSLVGQVTEHDNGGATERQPCRAKSR